MPHEEYLNQRLGDAYGMETAIIEVVGSQLPDLDGYQALQDKVLEHLNHTHRHANMVRDCLARRGGATSSLDKGGLTTFLGLMTSSWKGSSEGKPVRHAIADVAVEHFEIATYRALIAAATDIGDHDTVRACEEILREEEAMARWLMERLPAVVHQNASQADDQHDTNEAH